MKRVVASELPFLCIQYLYRDALVIKKRICYYFDINADSIHMSFGRKKTGKGENNGGCFRFIGESLGRYGYC